MKRLIIVILAVLFITLLLPLAVIHLIGEHNSSEIESPVSETIKVFLADEGRTAEMNINDYLYGVVAAEMPAEFEEEALKAQAVAARTYLYSHIEQFSNANVSDAHPDVPVCTDFAHCQAYISKEKRFESWGAEAEANWDKITRAVDDTSGQIMTYNGEIISALFHSTSSGTTEAAVDVWGSDVPYLKSVASEGDLQSPKYQSSLTMSEEEFKSTAEDEIDGIDWSKGVIGNIERSDAGGIIAIEIGGVRVKGTDFRSAYNLRSTNVNIEQKDGNIIMDVHGYGHGVGMSQYGANYMAGHGSGYEEILKTYYTGIEIEKR